MLEFVPSSESVLALKISNKIDGADLEAVMDRLDEKLARNDPLHVFVETRGIDGIDVMGLGRYSARALPLLGKLRRFGRVAVVADQNWVRIGTRIESAILPFINYRVYEPEEREEALRWVEEGPKAS